ncbi:MAG: hypothetical protein JXR70_02490 [Spirochaetales bacterium]|nr:hypothetical protein [Spirochaetales bacterium]
MKYLIFFYLSVIYSCSILSPIKPYEILSSDHCMITVSDEKISRNQFKRILDNAETAFLKVTNETGLKYSLKIPIIYDENRTELSIPSSAYVHFNTIYIQSVLFNQSDNQLIETLCHEITHVLMIGIFGISDSFLTTEGSAMFWNKPKNTREVQNLSLKNLVELSYYQLFLDNTRQKNPDYIYYCYQLSGLFAVYWINEFGWDHLFKLYRELTPQNAIQKIAELSGKPFIEIENIIKERF